MEFVTVWSSTSLTVMHGKPVSSCRASTNAGASATAFTINAVLSATPQFTYA